MSEELVAVGRAEADGEGTPVRVAHRWRAGLRRRWGVATGVVVVSAFLGVPLVWGDEVLPVDVPVIDNVAWLANDVRGEVVRVNGESGGVDARLGVGDTGGDPAEVAQAEGVALVEVDGVLRAIDVARLEWTSAVSAEGEVVVGDGAAFLVQGDGLVRSLDPESLSPAGEVDLGVALQSGGVVIDRRLVVPGADGRLHVVDQQGGTAAVGVGDPGDVLVTALVGEQAVAVNLTAGRLVRWELRASTLLHAGEVGFDVPEGRVVVPPRLPEGPLWLLAVRSGELHQVDLDTGEAESAQVTAPRHDVAGPVVAQGRVYLVDRATGEIVEVDAATLEVVHERSLEVDDASRVDVVVQGETVFVNDRASSRALVIDGDEHREVDKYRGGGDPGGQAPAPPGPPPADPAPREPGRPDGDVGVGDRAAPPSTRPRVDAPGVPPVPGPIPRPPGTTPTTRATTTSTTAPSTTTTTTRPAAPPGAVTGLTPGAGDGSVTLSWAAAPSPLPVTYTVNVAPAAPGGTTFTTGATSYGFTGLTNDVTYRFTVTPSNADGTGPAAQTQATPTSPDTGPEITYTLVREKLGEAGVWEVGFDYTLGTGSPVSCSVTRTDTDETQEGSCTGDPVWEYIGDFTIAPGDCADFTIDLASSTGTTTASVNECAPPAAPPVSPPAVNAPQDDGCETDGVVVSCPMGGAPASGGSSTPEPSTCSSDGVEFPCYVSPGVLASPAGISSTGGMAFPAGIASILGVSMMARRVWRVGRARRARAGR